MNKFISYKFYRTGNLLLWYVLRNNFMLEEINSRKTPVYIPYIYLSYILCKKGNNY